MRAATNPRKARVKLHKRGLMTDIGNLVATLEKSGGYTASLVVFAIWYFYHKAVTAQFEGILTYQQEREKEIIGLLKDSIETNKLILGSLEKLNSSIANNLWCPVAKEFHKGGLNVKPSDNAG